MLQGLRLFNLDIIREHGTRDRFYVIDINYFPGKFDFHTVFCSSLYKSHKHVVEELKIVQGTGRCQSMSMYSLISYWVWCKANVRNEPWLINTNSTERPLFLPKGKQKNKKRRLVYATIITVQDKAPSPSMLFFSFIVLYKEQWEIALKENPRTFGDLRTSKLSESQDSVSHVKKWRDPCVT